MGHLLESAGMVCAHQGCARGQSAYAYVYMYIGGL